MDTIFRKILDKIRRERLFKKGDKVILACSGGPDSLALLDILARLRPLFNLKISVAYFNHGLRPRESVREKEYVEKLSQKYGLHFTSGKGDVRAFARKKKISLQEAGRHLRYSFLFEVGNRLNIRKIALGHHRDDNVETILLGLFKGGGLKAISGIEPLRERGNFLLVRPMCDVSKSEITSYLSERKLLPCLDSSNLKETYLRNRLRLKVLPILRKDINPRVDEAVLRLGEIYFRENEYLDKVVSKDIKKVINKKGEKIYINRKNFLKRHIAIERRLLREIFGYLGIIGEGSNFRQIEVLRNFISTFHPGQKLDLARGLIARGGYGNVVIEKKSIRIVPPRRWDNGGIKMNVPGDTLIGDLDIKIRATLRRYVRVPSLRDMKNAFPEKVFLDAKKIKMPLYVRARKAGDFFNPLGMRGSIKVKKYFINAKIPQGKRKFLPLVVSGREIIWVVGYAINEKVRITADTKNVLILRQISLSR